MKKLFYLSCGFALLLAASCNKETPVPAPGPEPEDKAMNLSYEGTANCYLVYEAGDYSFDATVRGNGAVTEGLEKPEPLSCQRLSCLGDGQGHGQRGLFR